eukprot:6099718-Prymnesium_polylepis.3
MPQRGRLVGRCSLVDLLHSLERAKRGTSILQVQRVCFDGPESRHQLSGARSRAKPHSASRARCVTSAALIAAPTSVATAHNSDVCLERPVHARVGEKTSLAQGEEPAPRKLCGAQEVVDGAIVRELQHAVGAAIGVQMLREEAKLARALDAGQHEGPTQQLGHEEGVAELRKLLEHQCKMANWDPTLCDGDGREQRRGQPQIKRQETEACVRLVVLWRVEPHPVLSEARNLQRVLARGWSVPLRRGGHPRRRQW